MGQIQETIRVLEAENAELRTRLGEAEGTLDAIRSGEVEALVIGDQLFMLESAETASNRFRGHVLEQINEIVISIDPERRLTYLNPAAESKYGVRASDVLGRKLSELFEIRWIRDEDEAEAERAFKADGFWRGEAIHIKNDGSEFYVDLTVSRLVNDDKTPAGMLAVIRDVTARKQAEVELHEAHDKLEVRVDERTRELGETNLALREEMSARAKIEKQRTDLLQRIVSAQEDERRRIARDIHDQLGQRVTAMRLQIASLSEDEMISSKFAGKIELLQRTALRLDSEVSFLAWELRPASLDDLGLPEAAKAFLDEWSHNYKISSEFSLRGFVQKRLSPSAETHLYRIMQEALNNVTKHAAATRVNLLLEWNTNDVVLIVEDNGRGFDASNPVETTGSGKGLGLVGMRERATLVGGSVEIESSCGEGTTVYARVPATAIKSAA